VILWTVGGEALELTLRQMRNKRKGVLMLVRLVLGKLLNINHMYKAYEIDGLINKRTQSLVHAISNAQDGVLVMRLSKAVLAMFDATCWFSGLRSGLAKMKIADQNFLAGKIISACDKVQTELKAFHDQLDAADGSAPELAGRCLDARDSAKLLYEELELLRWDAMEWQAEADVGAGRVTGPFNSVEGLMASLMH
jgi:hypothetical protein